jgi:hypothetical protein
MSGGRCGRDLAANQGERDEDDDLTLEESRMQRARRVLQPEFDKLMARVESGELAIEEAKLQLARSDYKRG